MKCPFCGHQEDKVVDSRASSDGLSIRRRRECLGCGKRYTTYEQVEGQPLMVIKKDGRREAYDRHKVLAGLVKACEKRPVSMDRLGTLVDDLERGLSRQFEREVASKEIGERVMRQLHALDPVAYVRFASVYREFRDLEQFMTELKDVLESKGSGPSRGA